MFRRSTVIQLTIAFGTLAVGIAVYLFDRQPANVYFIPDWIANLIHISPIFGSIGNYLPTFIHVYAFIILSALVLQPTRKQLFMVCTFWFVIDCLFELGQMTSVSESVLNFIPGWFSNIPFLENTASYFLNGTFDILDLASITLGTIAAYLTIRFTYIKEKQGAPL